MSGLCFCCPAYIIYQGEIQIICCVDKHKYWIDRGRGHSIEPTTDHTRSGSLLWLRLGWSLKGQSDSVGLGLPLDEKTLFMSCQALAEQDHRSKELLSSDSSDG